MAAYAEKTSVSAERTQAEISETVRKYGAEGYMSGWEGNQAMIAFRARGRQVRFVLTLPERGDAQFSHTETGRVRTDRAAVEKAWDQEVRRRWRALGLCIKAKLEAVESGIASFDEEFMAHLVLADNTTVGERVLAELDAAPANSTPPRLLAIGGPSAQ